MKSHKFDVVVIGSGMGGVCTAARLSHKGFKVLLAERMAIIGGRCSTIDSKGLKKTTGAIIIPANSVIEDTFTELDLEYPVRKINSIAWRVNGKDHIWTVPEAIAQILMILADDKIGAKKILKAIERGLTWQMPTGSTSFRQWIMQFTNDEKVFQAFLPIITAWLCSNIDDLTIEDYFSLLKNQVARPWEIAIAPRGNVELLKPIIEVIESNGGEVWMDTDVNQILVKDTKATGVNLTTNKGEKFTISARAVVSNIGPKATVKLTGEDYFDKAYLKELEKVNHVPLYITVVLTSDEPLIEHQYLTFPIGAKKLSAMICPTNSCPELASKGRHILEIWGSMSQRVDGDIDVEKEIDATLKEIEQFIPSALDKGKVHSIECFDREWPCFRAMSSYLPYRTSVQELYNVGDGIRIPGFVGVTLAAETGRMVAEDIISHLQF